MQHVTHHLPSLHVERQRVEQAISGPRQFLQKVLDDGVMQFSGMMAYSLLLSVAPLLIGLLGIVGFLFFLTGHSSADLTTLIANRIGSALPTSELKSFTTTAEQNSGTLGIVGIITSLVAGAGFFLNADYAISIILRLQQRKMVRQWLMALGMVLLLIPLVVIIVFATSVPQAIAALVPRVGRDTMVLSGLTSAIIWLLSTVTGVIAAFILFLAIYLVVPNQHAKLKDCATGALVAAVLLEAYMLLFPFYIGHFLKPSHYGSSMAFALIVLVFFYYFAVIMLLGVEINSWLLGHRDLQGTLPVILHRIDEHGAAVKPDAAVPTTDPEQRLDASSPEAQ